MTLYEISQRIDKSEDNEGWVDVPDLACDQFHIDINYNAVKETRLRCYWIYKYECIDTNIGKKIYFLDDEPVCYSSQDSRKSSEYFRWFSEEAMNKVGKYLLTLVETDTYTANFIDINEDIGDYYQLHYNSEIIDTDKVMYQGEYIEIVEKYDDKHHQGIGNELKIRKENGEEIRVNIKDLQFCFRCK